MDEHSAGATFFTGHGTAEPNWELMRHSLGAEQHPQKGCGDVQPLYQLAPVSVQQHSQLYYEVSEHRIWGDP